MQEVTAKRQKFFPHKRTLKSLLSSFDSSFMKAYCLRDGQENHVISVAFFLYDNKRVYNIINGYFESNHPIAKTANLYTLHLGIKFALEKKLIFDFEGSLIPGVEKFYRLMGGSQELVCRFTKVKPFPLHIIYNTFKNLK